MQIGDSRAPSWGLLANSVVATILIVTFVAVGGPVEAEDRTEPTTRRPAPLPSPTHTGTDERPEVPRR